MIHYDLVVIGAGPGGYTAAIAGAKSGLSVALIEKDTVGGTCLNRGCIPTKALLHGAKALRNAQESKQFGVCATGVQFDEAQLYATKDETVTKLVQGILSLLKQHKITSYKEEASFLDAHTVKLSNSQEELTFTNVIIATGSKPVRLPLPGFDLPEVVSSDEVLAHPISAHRMVIIGGGVIGCELADYYVTTGKEVTIIEMQSRILSTMEKELAQSMAMVFKKRGIRILTNAKVTALLKTDEGIRVDYQIEEQQASYFTDHVLVSVGRTANLDGLNTEILSLAYNGRYLQVNAHYQTTQPHIYAIGDVNGILQLAHAASAQAENTIAHILHQPIKKDTEVIASCVYTTPEIASVGFTEEEAKKQGIPYQSGKFLLSANGRHLIETTERGYAKVLFDEHDVLIGAQLFGANATELISQAVIAITNRLTYHQLLQVVYPHPTISEGFGEAVALVHDEAIHGINKR